MRALKHIFLIVVSFVGFLGLCMCAFVNYTALSAYSLQSQQNGADNLLTVSMCSGYVGGSSVYADNLNNGGIHIFGHAKKTSIKTIGEVCLKAGEYVYSGIEGVEYKTTALQIWSLDNKNGTPVKQLCNQIGNPFQTNTFVIESDTWVRSRIIVYEGADIDVTVWPSIKLNETRNIDIVGITKLGNYRNLIVFDGGVNYDIYRSVNGASFNLIGTTKNNYFYDNACDNSKNNYSYYCADSTICGRSEVRMAGYCSLKTISVSCIMYHYFHTDQDLQNGCLTDGSIPVSEFENDLRYFKDNGIKTITISELISFVRGEIDLPKRCVLITIDDGHLSVYKYVYPLLRKYDCRANLSLIGEFIERAKYRKEIPQTNYWMNWQEISELFESGYFEMGSHSYYLHHASPRHGTSINSGESFDEYRNCLLNDMLPFNQLLTNYCSKPNFFAYPYNDPSFESIDILINELDYDFLFVGNGNYFSMTKNKNNIYAKGVGLDLLYTRFIRRVGRYTNDNMSDIIDSLYA